MYPELETQLKHNENRPESDAEILVWLATHPEYTVVVRCDTDAVMYKRRDDFAKLIAAADLGTLITAMMPFELRFFNGSRLTLLYTGGGDRWEIRLRGISNLTII